MTSQLSDLTPRYIFYAAENLNINIDELFRLEEKGSYMKYIRLVESAIVEWIETISGNENHIMKVKLWRRLVVISNSFAIRCIQTKLHAKAMELIDKSLDLIDSDLALLPENDCNELTAATKETQAYYYIRRAKPSAALQYIISASNIYKSSNEPSRFINIARCRLHEAFIQNRLNKHDKAMTSLKSIIAMVERGVLEMQDEKEVLLLCSSAYLNIAVIQLSTGHVSDSCVSSQNARRLARLCLSVSSHYLPIIESTHKNGLNQLSQMLQNNQNANLFQGLISELFD